ncbi:protein transport protein sft2 [Ostrinia furnacalis]|uniref:protein transport protein sft2 n=1 Tax=Ostrinia furnacalis TaxID=93504 RepID=UPI0010392963|nr:protein transport protein sft2 [Ostrinia furnacalis]
MANLKSELDEYMLQKESRRGYFTLPSFSTPSFLSRSSEDSSPTVSESSTWFQRVQNDYFTLSRTQRFMCFGVCLGLGILCFILSFIYIPVLLLQAKKFVLLFTLGSLFFLLSFSFLYGPWAHMKSLFSKERALTTSLYVITMVATLYCALSLRSTPLTVVCAVAQVISLFWMMTASIPGGSTGARFFGNMFKSSVSNTLPI